jgi:hypothetical protein
LIHLLFIARTQSILYSCIQEGDAQVRIAICLVAFVLVLAGTVRAQSPNATVNGRVLDTSGGLIADTTVEVINEATNVSSSTKTNSSGIYIVPDLPPATYRIQVSHLGFKTIIKPDVILNVRDAVEINFTLPIGAISETVTVEGGTPLIDTQDAAVSTVVDRQFAENLPMNGRSFQSLVELAPGAVLTVSNSEDNGQFSVNGQRAVSNYWTVDGVSANIGIGVSGVGASGDGLAGGLGSFSVLGGTNSLVSIDAMQEFRIQTSTYAPEFGRTPGAQISIVTRSGTNQFHGTAFDYVRNDALDANNWFNGYTNNPPLPKAKESQNDFGGTFAGPIVKDKTFFFFSYEGLRLQLPQTTLTDVPDAAARQGASPALQPYLNAFPFDPKQPDLGNGIAQFNASYSNPASLDAYSLRVDDRLSSKVNLFGRYDYSPSQIVSRGNGVSLSTVSPNRITTQTATFGTGWSITPAIINDFRFNYSRTNALSSVDLDGFGGAVPLTSVPLPSGYTGQNALFQLGIFALGTNGYIDQGFSGRYLQQQANVVDSLSVQTGSHSLKFGIDFRRLSPLHDARTYLQDASFLDVASAETGTMYYSFLESGRNVTFLFRNLGLFAQDTWRVLPRFTVTYGVRWDMDFVPSALSGPSLPAVTGFNLNNLSQLALAPAGTPPFKTTYGDFAPRLGIAYALSNSQDWGLVARGGIGIFYDLSDTEVGNLLAQSAYPYGGSGFSLGGTFPLAPAAAEPPPITPPGPSGGTLTAFDPSLKLPYTIEWNVALEQSLGQQQTISATYVGSAGRRLIQTAQVEAPNTGLAGSALLVSNTATSSYNALQLQFQRRLSQGFQALGSYTWSHSIDDASAGSVGSYSNVFSPENASANRGPSDFDVRQAFSAGLTYDVPSPKVGRIGSAILHGWSLQSIVQARSAPPVNVYYSEFGFVLNSVDTVVRPDLVENVPVYLFGVQYPGGKALNPLAFTSPPTDPSTGAPTRQGDLGRNVLRGFGASQWDFAVHRDFPIRESLKLQFRAEMFNVLNHPNFGQPIGDLTSPQFINPQFGLSTQILAQSLGGYGTQGSGALSSLYQFGGPRSIQFALKLTF